MRRVEVGFSLSSFLLSLLFHIWCSSSSEPIGYGYTLKCINQSRDGKSMSGELSLINNSSVYGPDVHNLILQVNFETPERLRVRITDADHARWEIPASIIPRPPPHSPEVIKLPPNYPSQIPNLSPPDSDLEFTVLSNHPFAFTISRRSSNETLFNISPSEPNSRTGIVFKDQYLEISSQIPTNAALYGLGEHTKDTLRLVPNDAFTMWNADIGTFNLNLNLYGSHPFYMDVRFPATGKDSPMAHGVLLMNSNGMDVEYGGSFVKYRVVGGVLDFYFFAGPLPENVVQQYTELVGRPAPMPYWSFGFHQCRYGYKNVSDLEGVVARYAKARIPLEVMWTDIDYMDAYKDFTLNPINFPANRMRQFVDNLHKNGQKYIVIIDPGINVNDTYATYQRGNVADVWVKQGGKPYLAQVWPGPVYFPDFFNPAASPYWQKEISEFHLTLPFDGLWIDMNEVSNFCSGTLCSLPPPGSLCPRPDAYTACCLVCSDENANALDKPPYDINNSGNNRPLGNKTLPASAMHHGNIPEYDAHNLYGLLESKATHDALANITNKRPFVLSRSTFIGSGTHTAHWTGDNAATWPDLARSVPAILSFGLFGVPMVGADICGFNGNTNEELCNRWIQLGAFYPFSRDHSDINSIRQELYLWDSVTRSAREALGLRYRLLPHFYTLMYEAHTKGTPIARPLFFSFPNDTTTYNISSQFMLGRGLMVSPVLTQGATSVQAYFPVGTWFNLFDMKSAPITVTTGQQVVLNTPLEKTNVHLREGNVLVMQESRMTTEEVRTSGFTIVVAVGTEEAKGELYIDDGKRMEMGGEGDGWSFVRFYGGFVGGGVVRVRSEVEKGGFASGQGLVIKKVVFPGLGDGMNPKTLSLIVEGKGMDLNGAGASLNNGVAEINGLSLLIGKEFDLRMNMEQKILIN
ncbi:probable alpha-glucosidase Os06g0675700 [Amborella trichopoda]|uniref:probable alpha-glucosidase Os06g0675700 n=1 Tax=Amborella trichopoda TaxID=13333 RepID=UPI0005D369B1|nr:probable alpha-glucosidase Os06g0675700 [Amborella trichopoda]|eukprot:XP_011620789.1 probable alpha-glucosidase Os06g0675700 [Amborella trichopoda]